MLNLLIKKALLSIVILTTGILYAQIPNTIDWQKTYGGDMMDIPRSICSTSDGGYVVVGTSFSGISGTKDEALIGGIDIWVLKMASNGIIEWQNTIGTVDDDVPVKIIQTSDGGYILGAYSDGDISNDKSENSMGVTDYWVIKLSSSGNIEWDNTIGGSSYDYLNSMSLTSDGGFILAGNSTSSASGDKTENNAGGADLWIVKLNASGTVSWEETIGGSSAEGTARIIQLNDGNFCVAVSSTSNDNGDKDEISYGGGDVWLLKLDSVGGIIWQNTIAGTDLDSPRDLIELLNGEIVCVANSRSNISVDKTENNYGGDDYWIIKVDVNGNIIWDKTFGGDQNDIPLDVVAHDNNILICGQSESGVTGNKITGSLGGSDTWLVQLNNSGGSTDQKSFGGDDSEANMQFVQSANGSICISASSLSGISGDKTDPSFGIMDYWIIHLASNAGIEALSNTNKSVVKIIDFLGRETTFKPNTPLIYIYSDGSAERMMMLEE